MKKVLSHLQRKNSAGSLPTGPEPASGAPSPVPEVASPPVPQGETPLDKLRRELEHYESTEAKAILELQEKVDQTKQHTQHHLEHTQFETSDVTLELKQQQFLHQCLQKVYEGMAQRLAQAERKKRLEHTACAHHYEQETATSPKHRDHTRYEEARIRPAAFSSQEAVIGTKGFSPRVSKPLPFTHAEYSQPSKGGVRGSPGPTGVPKGSPGGKGSPRGLGSPNMSTGSIGGRTTKTRKTDVTGSLIQPEDALTFHPDTLRSMRMHAQAAEATYMKLREQIDNEKQQRLLSEMKAKRLEGELETLSGHLVKVMHESAIVQRGIMQLRVLDP